ncbi:MAG: Uma2 family endonuclease [Cyanobacteria bacterium P01_F01_bin.33]
MQTLTFELPQDIALHVSKREFAAIAIANRELRLERTADGELIVSPSTGDDTGRRNANIVAELVIWSRRYGGVCYDSSTGFELPNGAMRSPDASWIEQSRYDALDSHEGFVPLCPDFVVELRSKSDRLSALQDKLHEYIANGTRLGWLIDPQNQKVEIYRGDGKVEVLDRPRQLVGEDVLPDFSLDLTSIW